MISLEDLKKELQGPQALVSKARRCYIPSGEELARKAWDRVSGGKKWSAEEILERFNDYLCALMDTEYQIYLEHEERCINEGVFEIALDPQSRETFPNVHELITQALATIHDVHSNDRTKLSLLTQNLIVRDEIKHTRFPDANNVIAFTAFIQKELPARRVQWQALKAPKF